MSRERKIKKIIDELFYRDVASIIESYLFIKCKECKKEYFEENMMESFDKEYYCYRCIKKPAIRMCCKCNKYYSIKNDGLFVCAICLKVCCVYCADCFVRNKISLYTFHDNPHYAYYWLAISDIEVDEDSDLDI